MYTANSSASTNNSKQISHCKIDNTVVDITTAIIISSLSGDFIIQHVYKLLNSISKIILITK